MILYFSGTGNTAYAAEKIAEYLDEEIISIGQRMKEGSNEAVHSERPFIFVLPTYGWRIPRVVKEWIEKTVFTGNKNTYFVMTCGAQTGNAGEYLLKLCKNKGWKYMGCGEVVMPDNYIIMFKPMEEKEIQTVIKKAGPQIEKLAERIRQGHHLSMKKGSPIEKLLSGPVNSWFYKMYIGDKKFYTTEACIGCGKCRQVCPLNNIELKSGKPVWKGNCTHCMACVSLCPKTAIEYGKSLKGKTRYLCPAKKGRE